MFFTIGYPAGNMKKIKHQGENAGDVASRSPRFFPSGGDGLNSPAEKCAPFGAYSIDIAEELTNVRNFSGGAHPLRADRPANPYFPAFATLAIRSRATSGNPEPSSGAR